MPSNPSVAWLEGDREWYPIWPTTLYEQEQDWRERLSLFTIDDCVERLAQEASLHTTLAATNEAEDKRIEDLIQQYLDLDLDEFNWNL